MSREDFLTNRLAERGEEVERLRALLCELLDAHWPLVETSDLEDDLCARIRTALGF